MFYDTFSLANSLRRQAISTTHRRHDVVRDVTTMGLKTLDMARISCCLTPPRREDPVDSPPAPVAVHLTGNLMLQCLDQKMEKEHLQERLGALASQMGVDPTGKTSDKLITDIGEQWGEFVRGTRNLVEEQQRLNHTVQAVAHQVGVQSSSNDPYTLLALMGQQYGTTRPELTTTQGMMMDSTADTEDRLHLDSQGSDAAQPGCSSTSTHPPVLPLPHPNLHTPPTPVYHSVSPHAPVCTPPLPSPPSRSSTVPTGPNPASPAASQTPVQPPAGPGLTPAQAAPGPSPPAVGAVGAVGSASPKKLTVWDKSELVPFDPSGAEVTLGSGAGGTVRLFRHASSGTPVAVKMFTLPSNVQDLRRKLADIQQEANTHGLLGQHRLFPEYHGCIDFCDGHIGIVMEFIGDAQTGQTMPLSKAFLAAGCPALTSRDWFGVASDIVQAVQHVHDTGFLLNDLKEDNVMLSCAADGTLCAKVIDFGWVLPQSEPQVFGFDDETKYRYEQNLTFTHIAPECALYDEGTSTRSDVFQLGRLLRAIGGLANDTNLWTIGEMCLQPAAMFRPTMDELILELDRLRPLY